MSEADGTKRNGPAISSKQRRRKKGSTKKSSCCLSLIPSDIVCTDRDLKKSKKSTELALFLGLTVVCLYLFGFVELMQSMPEISSRLRHYKVGGNLNLARMEMGSVISNRSDEEESDDGDDRRGDDGDGDGDDGDGDDGEEDVVEEKPAPTVQKIHGKYIPAVGGNGANDGDIPIPIGTWPVSVQHEELEKMVHVGDLKTIMEVPKFWSPPVHNNKQFTREQAMQIGTCAEPDPTTGSNIRGEDCPINQRTIFIGIASYRDYQCRQTLETAFRRAANPNRIRVGVVDQIVVGEDVACNEPIKACEEDPEQVRADTSTCATNREKCMSE
jgi:hypothetical protein